MVEICNISKAFGGKPVINNISFSLKKGEATAFVGVNGAGKSTVMNIMAGTLTPDTGKVIVNGVDLWMNPTKTKHKIGYLPEDNPLYGDMYVSEYLEYVGAIYLEKKIIRDRVDEIIKIVDLKNEYKKKIQTLSHGNKQRVGLAQALLPDPEILILDEPTNGLDPNQQFKINNLIREIGKSKIVLFSSHHLDDIASVASRYLFIKEGRLVADHSIEDIDSLKHYFQTIEA